MSGKSGYYKQVVELLLQHNFRMIKAVEGHQIWVKGSIRVCVPLDCKSTLSANAIMQICRIDYIF
jgi:predicted RNA binding protein YcfA (HicA-like mRNA interferase family)